MIGAMNIRQISAHDLAALGVQDMAFVKMVNVNDEIVYAVHAADGTQMALMSDRAVAFAAIRQNGMEPVSVH
jgi:hypothetical protein